MTFTATVAASNSTPTGTVTFSGCATSLGSRPLINGKATLLTNQLAGGSHSITAVYGGSTLDASSTSAPLSEQVNVPAQFASMNWTASVTDGQAVITVNLNAVSNQVVTVHYATSDGTALAGTDYQATSGNLSFLPGQTSNTFLVAFNPDAAAVNDKTVHLLLSSPGNAILGDPAQSLLVISSITVVPIGDQEDMEGDSVAVQVTAVDGNSASLLTYSASGLPAGLTIDSAGLISGTLANVTGNATTSLATVSVSNGASTVSQSFTWVVDAFIFDNPGDQTSLLGSTVSLDASSPDGPGIAYSSIGLPAGLTIDGQTGLISGTLTGSTAPTSPYSVTLTATNGTVVETEHFNWVAVAATGQPGRSMERSG